VYQLIVEDQRGLEVTCYGQPNQDGELLARAHREI